MMEFIYNFNALLKLLEDILTFNVLSLLMLFNQLYNAS